MSSQIVTTSTYKYRRTSHLPYVFTEQGISMLSPLLNSEIAIQVSINIMDAFVDMRRFMMSKKKKTFKNSLQGKENLLK